MTHESRDFDVVLFGATGFTGGLTAEYLAAHGPDGMRWALAGRNPSRLEAVRRRLGVDVELLHADATDAGSLAEVAPGPVSSSPPSAPTSSTAGRWSRRARRPAPTTST
ncbi:MAG TPA: saccharopine dehydrogenase NADP-binding domain-containing protein [Nocardioides sp.]